MFYYQKKVIISLFWKPWLNNFFIWNDRKLFKGMKSWRTVGGAVASPFNCWIASNGIQTLPFRMDYLSKSTLELAQYLEGLPCIPRVLYPLLSSHSCFQIANKLFDGKGPGEIPNQNSLTLFHRSHLFSCTIIIK